MAAVGNYEVVEETFGPFTGVVLQEGEVDVPSGKRFLGVSYRGTGGASTITAYMNSDGTKIIWRLKPTAASLGSTITVIATAAEMGD